MYRNDAQSENNRKEEKKLYTLLKSSIEDTRDIINIIFLKKKPYVREIEDFECIYTHGENKRERDLVSTLELYRYHLVVRVDY